MAIDNKYGKVNFAEPNTIGADEPVVVFRAADPLLPQVLAWYEDKCRREECPDKHLMAIAESRAKVMRWQYENPDDVRYRPTSDNWDGQSRVEKNRVDPW